MELENNVFLNTINVSPKFRQTYIKVKIDEEKELSQKVCEFFELNLVIDVYMKNIRKESYNSKKRLKLKRQEIIFIKKVQIYKTVISCFENLQKDITELDSQYTFEFQENFHSPADKEFFEVCTKEIIDNYFNDKYE